MRSPTTNTNIQRLATASQTSSPMIARPATALTATAGGLAGGAV